MWSKTYQSKYLTLKEMHEQNMLLSSSTLQQYDVNLLDLTSIYVCVVQTHRVHLNDSDEHSRHTGFASDYHVETCVKEIYLRKRWTVHPFNAYIPTFIPSAHQPNLHNTNQLGHIYRLHLLNSKCFGKDWGWKTTKWKIADESIDTQTGESGHGQIIFHHLCLTV